MCLYITLFDVSEIRFRCVCKIWKATISFYHVCLSVHPHGTTRLPLDGFLWNLIFQDFSKICPEISSFIKIWQGYWVLYIKTYVHLWYYLAQFFLGWGIFQTKVVANIKIHIAYSITFFFFKLCHLWDNMEKHGRGRQVTDANIICSMRFACSITKATDTHS
jgi:hypothetical protein